MSRFRMPYALDQDFFHIARDLDEQNVELIAEVESLKERERHGLRSRMAAGVYWGILAMTAATLADHRFGTSPRIALALALVAIPPAYGLGRYFHLRWGDRR